MPGDHGTKGSFTISFNSSIVDWNFLRSIYGWSGIQFQAWARGSLVICPAADPNQPEADKTVPVPVALHISPTLEFFVDKNHYFGGDMYSYHRSPLILHLSPGVPHTLDIRVTHDIRAFGGGMPPALAIDIEAEIADGGLIADADKAIVPDIVAGKVAGSGWISVPVRNELAKVWVDIVDVVPAHHVCLMQKLYNGNDQRLTNVQRLYQRLPLLFTTRRIYHLFVLPLGKPDQ